MFLRLQLRAGAGAAARVIEATGTGLSSGTLMMEVDEPGGEIVTVPWDPKEPESAAAQKIQCVQIQET